MKLRGALFDCDGLLVNSEPLSCGAWNIVFQRKFGVDIGNDYSAIYGTSSRETISHFAKAHGLDIPESDYGSLEQLKDDVYFESAAGNLRAFDGAKEVIARCRHLGMRVAVASSGSAKKITFNLLESGLLSCLDGCPLVSAKDPECKHGKPEPDVFVLAARRIGVEPSECVVLEDAVTGMQAAAKAGCQIVAVGSTFTVQHLREHQPPGSTAWFFSSMKELTNSDFFD
jgi:HAD superfamily hydrolase (TIGR01509 family)